MSVSMTPTRLPARATSTARLAVVFDLPVPPRKECVEMILAKRLSPGGSHESCRGRQQIAHSFALRLLNHCSYSLPPGSLCSRRVGNVFLGRLKSPRLFLQFLEQRVAHDLIDFLLFPQLINLQHLEHVRTDVVERLATAVFHKIGV